MIPLKAFIGHSFTADDEAVVRAFLKFFDQIREMNIGFSWEHAEPAEPKELAEKVLRLMHDKNLFIGICTTKEAVILPSKLTQGSWNKNILKASKESVSWKTSDWIIQEVGLAIGKGMDVILLVENGVRQPGGLLGNKEWIPFDRQSPEKSFGKVLEMIQSLIPKAKTVTSGEGEVRTAAVERSDSEPRQEEEWLKPRPDWQREDFEFALLHTVFLGEKEKENAIVEAYLATEDGQSSHKRNSWEAYHELIVLRYGKGGKLTNLDELAAKYPENAEVLKHRAEGYQFYGEHEKAACYFEIAAQKAGGGSEALDRYGDAALAFTRAARIPEANRVVEQMKSIAPEGENGKIQLLYTLRGIAEIENANDHFCSLTEKILDLRPGDIDLRFNLAYKYSQDGATEDLSLYHYLKIPYRERTSITWNNLGVQFEHFELDNKSVTAYQKSDELGETLAMSNLAQKLIKAGFLKEAEDICNRAIKEKDYHKNVGHAITRIRDVPEIEKSKEEEIIKKAAPISEFFRDYGQALAKKTVGEHEGRWKGPKCELRLTIKSNSFIAEGSYERSESGLIFFHLTTPGGTPTVSKYLVRYQGSILGKAVKAVFTQSKEGESPQTLLGGASNETAVLMILSDSLEEIRVYEKDSKKEDKFYKINRLS